MHRLAAGRASGQFQNFSFKSIKRGKLFSEFFHHDVTVKFRNIGPLFPRNGFQLNLANGVFWGRSTGSVGVQASSARKGKDTFDTRMGKNDFFYFAYHGVFFIQSQIATGFDINDRLLRFGFNEKLNTIVVFAEIGIHAH